jgi:predicted aspartyl protease
VRHGIEGRSAAPEINWCYDRAREFAFQTTAFHTAVGGPLGLTVLEVDVGNPGNPEVTRTIEFLIDSGAIYSVVPTPILEGLGIKPLAQQDVRFADGTKIVRNKGTAIFKYGGRVGGADVIFGEDEDHTLLGPSRWRLWDCLSIRCGGNSGPCR